MSSLRTAAIKIAADLPKGDPTRRKLLATIVKAKRAENPAQKAIWNAWDAMSGIEKVREYDSFDGATGSFALSTQVSDGLYGTFYEKAADGLERKLKSLDRQSRSWRTGYNMWLEGKDIDTDRIANDMSKSLKIIKTMQDALVRMSKMAREHPEAWSELDDDYRRAVSGAGRTVATFENALGVLKSGVW
jgi:hypothetical protein